MSTLEAQEPLSAEVEPHPVARLEKSIGALHERVSKLEEMLGAHETLIDALLHSTEETSNRVEQVEKSLQVLRVIGEWKRRTCRHHKDGVCTAWRVNNDAIPSRLVDGVRRPLVAREQLICAVCPLYDPKNH